MGWQKRKQLVFLPCWTLPLCQPGCPQNTADTSLCCPRTRSDFSSQTDTVCLSWCIFPRKDIIACWTESSRANIRKVEVVKWWVGWWYKTSTWTDHNWDKTLSLECLEWLAVSDGAKFSILLSHSSLLSWLSCSRPACSYSGKSGYLEDPSPSGELQWSYN